MIKTYAFFQGERLEIADENDDNITLATLSGAVEMAYIRALMPKLGCEIRAVNIYYIQNRGRILLLVVSCPECMLQDNIGEDK